MSDARIFYQEDCNISMLEGKTIAIIGYGSQGHAHALNLKESGLNVIVGLYEGSKSKAKAEAQGLTVMNTADAAKAADVIMILINDEKQAKMYQKDIAPNLKAGDMLMFAHGFNIHFGLIKPPADVDVTMIAPKAPGHTVRTRQARAHLPWWLYIRMLPARPLKRLWLTAQASALQEQVSLRQPSAPRLRPTCSASRQFSAAVSAL